MNEEAMDPSTELAALRFQMSEWRAVAKEHLPPTDCDRCDAEAVSRMIRVLQAQVLAEQEKAAWFLAVLHSACMRLGELEANKELIAVYRFMLQELGKEGLGIEEEAKDED